LFAAKVKGAGPVDNEAQTGSLSRIGNDSQVVTIDRPVTYDILSNQVDRHPVTGICLEHRRAVLETAGIDPESPLDRKGVV
jgi:hypothetical protein